MNDPRHTYERHKCEACDGTGRVKGTRERAGNCGTRRGATLKKCPECMGDGYVDVRVQIGPNAEAQLRSFG